MDSRSLPVKSPMSNPQEHLLQSPHRIIQSPTNIIYSPSAIIRSPVRQPMQTNSLPMNMRIVPSNVNLNGSRNMAPVYQNARITSPVQTVHLGNSQMIFSPSSVINVKNAFTNGNIALTDSDLEMRYMNCVNRSKDLLAAYGYAMKEMPDYTKMDVNELYERALRKSQETLLKYSEAIERKGEHLFKAETRESPTNPLYVFQYLDDEYIYDGEVMNEQRNGYGVAKNEQGNEIYAGEWENNELSGKGRLQNLSAEQLNQPFDYKNFNSLGNFWVYYEGDFRGSLFDGMGDLMLSNEEKFVGKFVNGVVHGEGCFYRNNGEMELGLWENNILVKDL